jgi:hypothetical protein
MPVPDVEGNYLLEGAAADGSVATPGPPDHDVPGEHPLVGDAHGVAEQLLSAVRGPTGHTGAEPEGAGGEQEILHGREDRTAEKEL